MIKWENCPKVRQILFDTDLEKCQSKLNGVLDSQTQHFIWLTEIVEEASKALAKKSVTLEQMPKTPSVKQRAQRRGRKKQNVQYSGSVEDCDGIETPTLPKKTKLKFDNEDQENGEATRISLRGRPLRNCRQNTKIELDEKHKITCAPTNPRKLTTKNTDTSKSSSNTHVSPMYKIESTIMIMDSDEENQLPVASKAKKKSTVIASNEDSDDNNSPSVRDRATAYESMLKHRSSNSPVKSLRAATPESVPTKRQAGITAGEGKKIGSALTTPSTSDSARQPKRVSSHRRSSHRRGSRRLKAGKEPPHANRTKLKLRKKQEIDTTDSGDLTEVDKTAHSSSGKLTLPAKPAHLTPNPTHTPQDAVETTQDATQTAADPLNETETFVTEVFEIENKGCIKLKEFERIQIKTTPVTEIATLVPSPVVVHPGSRKCLSSDQGFNDGDDEEEEAMSDEATTTARSTRTRDRAMAQLIEMESLISDSPPKDLEMGHSDRENTTFTKDDDEPAQVSSEEPVTRSTRTRARVQQREGSTVSEEANELSRNTRTRQKKTAEVTSSDNTFTKNREQLPESQTSTRTRSRQKNESIASSESVTEGHVQSTRTRTRAKLEIVNQPEEPHFPSTRSRMRNPTINQPEEPHRPSTRSRMRNPPNNPAILLCDDGVIARSPTAGIPKTSICGGKKRLIEERGASPRPKRSRSCIGDATIQVQSPLLTSPLKCAGLNEVDDIVGPPCPMRKNYRVYQFDSAQKKTPGFLNRTPGFSSNTSLLYSFLNTSGTPSMRQNTILTSFLKRNTPPPKQNMQAVQEQKKQKLIEKMAKDKERIKKATELRKIKVEEQKRHREERIRKVAEANEKRQLIELEQKYRLNKKQELNATIKEKIQEEKAKEEKEKHKLRLRKQMEADARRKQEEEERIRKHKDMEEEMRQQHEYMQRRKDHEEVEKRRMIAEERKKYEVRIAEMEHKRQDELIRLKQQEEEKHQERDRQRLEREKMLALQRADRERIERENRELKDKKIAEEKDKLKALEKERKQRLAEEAQHLQKSQEALQKIINQHNQNAMKPATLNTTETSHNGSSDHSQTYDMTPVKKKVYVSTNSDNYGLDDKFSDDSTDEDDAPKKRIPGWAMGVPLSTALIRQPEDLAKLFRTSSMAPLDLEKMFAGGKKRFKPRTSSAIWISPTTKQC